MGHARGMCRRLIYLGDIKIQERAAREYKKGKTIGA